MQDVEDSLSSSAITLSSQMINSMRALMYIESTSSSPIMVDFIKHAHKILTHREKHRSGNDVFVGEYRNSPVQLEYLIFAPVNVTERL